MTAWFHVTSADQVQLDVVWPYLCAKLNQDSVCLLCFIGDACQFIAHPDIL